MLRSAVKAKPVVNMLFIFTSDRSRLLFFSFSSSLSIFFLCCLSNESPWVSLRRSTANPSLKMCHSLIYTSLLPNQ